MKSVTFLIPGASGKPTGGVKVVVEYANRLAINGFKVNIVYTASLFFLKSNFKKKVKQIMSFVYYWLTRKYSVKEWIYLNPNIKEYWVRSLCERHIPQSEIFIATAVPTAMYLNKYKNNVKKFYLIQDYETWTPGYSEEDIWETYRYQMTRIVISDWLREMLCRKKIPSVLIKNGFDFEYFKLSKDIKERNKFEISMLYHILERKGIVDGIEALQIVRQKYPHIHVKIFGVYKKPKMLPGWFEYIQKPDKELHNQIYNESAIFLGTSHSEGWGLTIGEAMICGCAVVCTDNLGYKEMAQDGVNALVVPVKNPKLMAEAIIRLISDNDLRYQIASRGHELIQNFTWTNSFRKFQAQLEKA